MSAPCIVSSAAGTDVWRGRWPTAQSWELGLRVGVWTKIENDGRMAEVVEMWNTQLAAMREVGE